MAQVSNNIELSENKENSIFENENDHLCVLYQSNYVKIHFDDIVMIKSISNYSYIYKKDGRTIFTSKTLKYWCDKINNSNFVRCHASYLINKLSVVKIEKNNSKLILNNGETVKYSRNFDIKSMM